MDYRAILNERYANSPLLDKDDLLMLRDLCDDLDGCSEEDLIDWLKNNPDASFQDMLHYVYRDHIPLEIVDDDDLYEDE